MPFNEKMLIESAHGAGDSRTGREGHGANSSFIMGYADTGIYPAPPTKLEDVEDLSDEELEAILDIKAKINGGPSVNIDHGRAPLTLSSPISEAPRLRSAGYPETSLGMVTPASRALNSPKSIRATVKTGKGTAMSGANTQINPRRPTGSIRDFSAGTQDLNQNILDEPVYDLSDILVHKDDDRGNIEKLKKLTWILQNDDKQ